MKNPATWVFGINLVLHLLCLVFFSGYFLSYLAVSFALNLIIGIILSIAGKKDLGQLFLIAPFLLALIGLGVYTIIWVIPKG